MNYLILIYSHPEPWGHPTIEHTPEGRALSPERRAEMDRDFDALLAEIQASGELKGAQALAAPASARTYRWGSTGTFVSDGPFAETKEVLAGFFLVDCETPERAEAIAERFASPGDTIELRPTASD